MALHTVFQLKNSVAGLLSGIDLNNVDDLNGCLERAASTLVQKADIPEASNTQNITLYSGVTDYACDSRIFGTAINDIRPQGISRPASNFVTKTGEADFDRTKGIYYPSGTVSTFQYVNGAPIIRITSPFTKQQVNIDQMNDITGWTASGSASAVVQDTTDYYKAPASLRFTLTGASTGVLTKTLTSPINVLSYQGVGVSFLAIEIPSTATNLTSISLKLGSDSSNYNLVTNTSGFLGAWVSGNWLLVAFDFSGASTVGTPNWNSLAYVQVSLAHSAGFTNFRIGGLWLSLPTPAQILFQSSAIFLASGSTAPTTAITVDTDTIILTDPAYNLYLYESASAVLQNTGAGASDATSIKINGILHGVRARNGAVIELGLYDLYHGDNPSQELRQTGSWYDGDASYNRWN